MQPWAILVLFEDFRIKFLKYSLIKMSDYRSWFFGMWLFAEHMNRTQGWARVLRGVHSL